MSLCIEKRNRRIFDSLYILKLRVDYMNYKIVNKMKPEQLKRYIRKVVKNGENYITIKEEYDEKKKKDNYIVISRDYEPQGFQSFFNRQHIYFSTHKGKEFEDNFYRVQSNMCRTFTGMKFEFEWDPDQTVEEFASTPYNSFFD